ncbi:MAG: hypothetical protein AB8F26_10275 [Phycisphaerales bacterium]
MYAKAVGFVVILLLAGGLILDRSPRFTTFLLLLCVIWASARVYYFCFYVVERYIDPGYRFAGVLGAVKHVISG